MGNKVNGAGRAHANSLVDSGDVDRTSSWSFSSEDGNKLLGPNGDDWPNYSKWHLGINSSEADNTKAHYKYPFGKNGKVYRSGIIAAKSRAGGQGDSEIESAASSLLAKIDKNKDSSASMVNKLLPFPDNKQTGVYRMSAKNNIGEIVLYGPIGASMFGGGVSLEQFRDDLKALGKVNKIDVRINSEGGDVFDGRAMSNLLAEHPAVKICHVDGLAASIASVIAMVGKEIHMADGAFMMIHNPWGGIMGSAKELRRYADLLESVQATLVNTYVARTRNTKDKIQTLMDAETWMSADEAKALGFADFVAEPVKAVASLRKPEIYKNLPSALRPNRAIAIRAANQIAAFAQRPAL